jgi:hypothetical protein
MVGVGPFLTLERLQAKWIPVRVKKTRRNKKLEPGSDSIRTEKALECAKPSPKALRKSANGIKLKCYCFEEMSLSRSRT